MNTMRLYAATPGRKLLQLTADLLFVAWLVLWVGVGLGVHHTTQYLGVPGRETAESATVLAHNFSQAGDKLRGVPMVGDEVAVPFDQAEGAANRLADAGRAQVAAVNRLAVWLGVAIATIPILIIAIVHVPVRWRFIRRASAGQRFIDAGSDLDLFALRALASQPMHVLARISPDPAGAWRRQDPEVISRLAVLELKSSGLRPPRVRGRQTGSEAG